MANCGNNVRLWWRSGRTWHVARTSVNDPNVWSGRAVQEDFVDLADAVLHQCIRSLIGARRRSGPSWISARVRRHERTGLAWAIWVTSVRLRREDRSPSRLIFSQTSAGRGTLARSSIVPHLGCSFVRAMRRSFVPAYACGRAGRRGCQGRPSYWTCRNPCALRPCLDGPEHGATLTLAGTPSHPS
jgi:hypothetical protein